MKTFLDLKISRVESRDVIMNLTGCDYDHQYIMFQIVIKIMDILIKKILFESLIKHQKCLMMTFNY